MANEHRKIFSMFGHFSTLWNKGLKKTLFKYRNIETFSNDESKRLEQVSWSSSPRYKNLWLILPPLPTLWKSDEKCLEKITFASN